nr:MAG TPA: hypothetical protein [Caudoviricetes sp.]
MRAGQWAAWSCEGLCGEGLNLGVERVEIGFLTGERFRQSVEGFHEEFREVCGRDGYAFGAAEHPLIDGAGRCLERCGDRDVLAGNEAVLSERGERRDRLRFDRTDHMDGGRRLHSRQYACFEWFHGFFPVVSFDFLPFSTRFLALSGGDGSLGRVFLGVGVLKQPGNEAGADRRADRLDRASASRDVAMQVGEPEPVDVIPTAERPRNNVLH